MFEFEGEVYWRAKSTRVGDDRSSCQGKIKVHEFNQEDDELQTDVTCGTDTEWANNVRRIVQNEVSDLLLQRGLSLVKALKEKDIDEERLARARAEEAAAAENYQAAQEQSGAQKQAIADQQKKKEEEMKVVEAQRAPQQISAAAPKQIIQGTGSVWNTNSYHWEEKSVATWANDTLRSCLSAFNHKMNDATMTISEIVSLTGESSVSIRKGKKIISYDYVIVLKWQVVLGDADGNQVSKMEGKYELPDMSNDDEWNDWEVRVEFGEDADNLRSMLEQMVRTIAPKALKQAIDTQFVQELKKK